MGYNVWVITRRMMNTNGRPMEVAVDYPSSWTESTNQIDATQYELVIAQGQLDTLAEFNVLAGGTFPGIAVAANAPTCLVGFELVDEFFDITTSTMDSEIGTVDRAKFLTFIDNYAHDKSDGLSQATTDGMTRRAFLDALIAAFSEPVA